MRTEHQIIFIPLQKSGSMKSHLLIFFPYFNCIWSMTVSSFCWIQLASIFKQIIRNVFPSWLSFWSDYFVLLDSYRQTIMSTTSAVAFQCSTFNPICLLKNGHRYISISSSPIRISTSCSIYSSLHSRSQNTVIHSSSSSKSLSSLSVSSFIYLYSNKHKKSINIHNGVISSKSMFIVFNFTTIIGPLPKYEWISIVYDNCLIHNTTEYRWKIEGNLTSQSQFMFGICTESFNKDMYIGEDQYSWGIISNKYMYSTILSVHTIGFIMAF